MGGVQGGGVGGGGGGIMRWRYRYEGSQVVEVRS